MSAYNTRALVRAVYPHIEATGRSPSPQLVREKVRELYPDIPIGWNPSDTTITDELRKVRIENGERQLAGRQIPGVKPGYVEPLADLAQRFEAVVLAEVESAFSQRREELAETERLCRASVVKAEQEKQLLAEQLEEATRRHGLVEARLSGELESLREALESLRGDHAALQERLVRSESQLAERTSSLEASEQRCAEQQQRFDEQLRRSEDAYRGLERAKLMELDTARQQRDKALRELDDQKALSAETMQELGRCRQALAAANGQLNATREQQERDSQRFSVLEQEHRQMMSDLAVANERLSQACKVGAEWEERYTKIRRRAVSLVHRVRSRLKKVQSKQEVGK